jgi:CHAT domain-containing protein/tetratricopeptide (TPR) repeat protein
MCATALLLWTLSTHAAIKDDAHHIAALSSDDERLCAITAAGGYTPQLRDAIADELKAQRAARGSHSDASLAHLLERLGREHGDAKAVDLAVTTLGTIEESARHWEAAEALYEEGAAIARACADDATLADALYGLAFVHTAEGYSVAAPLDLVEARAASERAGTRYRTGLILNQLGLWKRNHGELNEGIADLQQARALMQAEGNTEGIAGITNNIGGTWKQLGDFDQAVKAFEQAISYAETIKNDRIIAFALNNLGGLYVDSGNYERALPVFQRSLALKKKLGDPSVSSTEVNLGEVARRRHKSAEAFGWYSRSLADAVALSDWEHIVDAQTDMAALAIGDGQLHLGLDLATHAAGLAVLHNQVVGFSVSMTERAGALRLLGHPDQARDAYEQAIASIEEERAHAAGPEPRRALFLEHRLEPYFGLVSLLRTSDTPAALACAEKTKARVLMDLLQSGPIEPGAPIKIGADEAVIEFVTSPEETIAFVLTGSRVRTRLIALAGPELARRVRDFRSRIAERDLSVDATGSRLFHDLLAKIWPMVSERHHLVIVPDGPLWELPFAALVTPDGHYLIEHATITLAPSIGALAAMHARAARKNPAPVELLAFGNSEARGDLPALPQAESQARAVAVLYGSQGHLFAGAEATRTRLESEIPNARVVHIATHGVLNDANPMYSHLVLRGDARNDGLLDARTIMHLPLRSELVVLSACETARGRMHQGEGVVGLAWAFFLAGCPSTVVSQWDVDATTTTTLMVRFHQRLTAGATKSAALRDAALSVLQKPESRHPFYWAPFVLIGDDAKLQAH